MAHPCYPPLEAPELDPALLKRRLKVRTRLFYADSAPGAQATVVRFWTAHNGTWVRCNYGENRGGKSIFKTMPANVLTLADT